MSTRGGERHVLAGEVDDVGGADEPLLVLPQRASHLGAVGPPKRGHVLEDEDRGPRAPDPRGPHRGGPADDVPPQAREPARERAFRSGSRFGRLYWTWVYLLRWFVPPAVIVVFLDAVGAI